MDRAAVSPREFASFFGKSPTWGYRQIYAGHVNAVTEVGRILIPITEIDKILSTAGRYTAKKRASPGEPKRQQEDLRKMMRRAHRAVAKRSGTKKAHQLPQDQFARLSALGKNSQPAA